MEHPVPRPIVEAHRHASRVFSSGTSTVSFQASGRTGAPCSSSTWKKKPCRWNGCDHFGLVLDGPDLRLADAAPGSGFALPERDAVDRRTSNVVRRLCDQREIRSSTGVAPARSKAARSRATDAAAGRRRAPGRRRIGSSAAPRLLAKLDAAVAAIVEPRLRGSARWPGRRAASTMTSTRSPAREHDAIVLDGMLLQAAVAADDGEPLVPRESRWK